MDQATPIVKLKRAMEDMLGEIDAKIKSSTTTQDHILYTVSHKGERFEIVIRPLQGFVCL